MLEGDDDDARREVERRHVGTRQRRVGAKPELQELDAATREHGGVGRVRLHDYPFDVGRELRLRPDDLIDPEVAAQAAGAAVGIEEVLPGDEADRPAGAQLTAERTRDDVDLVVAGGPDEEVAALGAGAPQHVRVGTAAGDELHVELGETLGPRGVEVDHEDVLVLRESLGEQISDRSPADDDDVHSRSRQAQPVVRDGRSPGSYAGTASPALARRRAISPITCWPWKRPFSMKICPL